MTEVLPRHRRLVLWGFTSSKDSFRHIHRHYAHALTRLGKPWVWLADEQSSRSEIRPGDLVFAVDVEARQLGAPVDGASYLLHNMNASHPVWDGLEPERFLRLQVYTRDADQYGVEWEAARRYDRESRTLFQPWGTDLLADEFHEPCFNGSSRRVSFVGSVWDGGGLGNLPAITELKRVLIDHDLQFRHLVHVSDDVNIAEVRTSRFAPAVAGPWQCEKNYLPCRVFKNVSYGALGVTNVPMFETLFGNAACVSDSIEQLVDRVLQLGEDGYLEMVRTQQEAAMRYTYRESLLAITRAFEE